MSNKNKPSYSATRVGNLPNHQYRALSISGNNPNLTDREQAAAARSSRNATGSMLPPPATSQQVNQMAMAAHAAGQHSFAPIANHQEVQRRRQVLQQQLQPGVLSPQRRSTPLTVAPENLNAAPSAAEIAASRRRNTPVAGSYRISAATTSSTTPRASQQETIPASWTGPTPPPRRNSNDGIASASWQQMWQESNVWAAEEERRAASNATQQQSTGSIPAVRHSSPALIAPVNEHQAGAVRSVSPSSIPPAVPRRVSQQTNGNYTEALRIHNMIMGAPL